MADPLLAFFRAYPHLTFVPRPVALFPAELLRGEDEA